jgi:hypothetical protein
LVDLDTDSELFVRFAVGTGASSAFVDLRFLEVFAFGGDLWVVAPRPLPLGRLSLVALSSRSVCAALLRVETMMQWLI